MKKSIRQIKGFTFSAFCIGSILSFFWEISFEILLYGGVSASIFFLIDSILNIRENRFRFFLHAGISIGILSLIAYSHDLEYQKELEIAALVALGIWGASAQINGILIKELSELINTWHLKICLVLILIYALLPLIRINQQEYVLMGIFVLLSVWSIEHLILKEKHLKN